MKSTLLNSCGHHWLSCIVAVVAMQTCTVSFGQAVPGAQPAGILPAGGIPGLFGQGVQVQVPQLPQFGLAGQTPQYGPFAGGYRRSGYGSGYGFGGGSTPFGSAMSGQAAILSGQGMFELGTAQGNLFNQQATSMYFDTYKQAVNTYFDVKRIHDTARAEHEKSHATREQLEAAARIGAPQRLSKEQYESTSGKIAWPEVLSKEMFAGDRLKIEQLFKERTANGGGQGTDNFRAIRLATNQMQSRLQGMVTDLTPQEYVVGHKFIAGLAHEASLIPHPGAAASK